MLFLLTGDIQTGKTRWLSGLVEDLAATGVHVAGVLAPGVWRERSAEEIAAHSASENGDANENRGKGKGEGAGESTNVGAGTDTNVGAGAGGWKLAVAAGAGRFEKLGIDNVLLPDGERVPFARRRDLARAYGAFHADSQSAQAGLAWEMDDAAIGRVNAHFSALARAGEGRAAASAGAAGGTGNAPAEAAANATGAAHATSTRGAKCPQPRALLVVDELGRLELVRGAGLSEAVRLLQAGPSPRFPHAIAVVRESLLPQAHARLDTAWDGARELFPDDAAREEIARLFS